MTEWILREHPDLFRDLRKLTARELDILHKKRLKIKENPVRMKHLHGGANCYREPITDNVRLVYYIEGNVIWFLAIGKHKEIYEEYLKRLYSLKIQEY